MKTGKILFFMLGLFLSSGYAATLDRVKPFLPDHCKLQFAGSIGFLSTGIGYTFLNNRIDLELYYGFVPSFAGNYFLHSVTLKNGYHFLRKKLKHTWSITPLSIGLFTNYAFGDQFYLFLPKNYPDGYFFWSSALRCHIFLGTDMEKTLSRPFMCIRQVGGYLEFNSNDLYLVSFFGNIDYFSILDIIRMGMGMKISF
jgi:hypothetical protein